MQPNGSVHALLATWLVLPLSTLTVHIGANRTMATQKAKNTAFKKTKFQFPVSWSKPIIYVPCKSLLCSLEALMFLSGIFCVVLYFSRRCVSLGVSLKYS